jgi:hypothetical protein
MFFSLQYVQSPPYFAWRRLQKTGLAAEMLLVLADGRCRMMRVTVLDGEAEERLMVEGQLTGPYIPELESTWNQARQDAGSRPIVIDLTEVTRIGRKGEAALVAMVAEGARLRAKGIYWGYVVKQLLSEARRARARWHRGGSTRAKDLSPGTNVR